MSKGRQCFENTSHGKNISFVFFFFAHKKTMGVTFFQEQAAMES